MGPCLQLTHHMWCCSSAAPAGLVGGLPAAPAQRQHQRRPEGLQAHHPRQDSNLHNSRQSFECWQLQNLHVGMRNKHWRRFRPPLWACQSSTACLADRLLYQLGAPLQRLWTSAAGTVIQTFATTAVGEQCRGGCRVPGAHCDEPGGPVERAALPAADGGPAQERRAQRRRAHHRLAPRRRLQAPLPLRARSPLPAGALAAGGSMGCVCLLSE